MRFVGFSRLPILICACVALAAAGTSPMGTMKISGAAKPAAIDGSVLQKEIVAALSGESEIRGGIKVANRTSLENKKEVRAYLADLITRLGMQPRRQGYGTEGENIFTILPCGRPGAETVVFGAHYDSARNSPGANDNATGVAAVAAVALETSRIKKRSRDFIFVFFDEEERGLRGSRAFAQMLKDENRNVNSVHTIDQMGWDEDGDRAIELELPYDGAQDLYREAAAMLKWKAEIHTTEEAGSDHSAFRRLGYRAVGITEEYRNKDTTPYIHRPGDIFGTVNFEYLRSTTKLLAEVMNLLAR